MKHLKCGSVIPGCDWQTHANSQAEVIRRACQHMRRAHGIEVITDNMMHAVKAQIAVSADPPAKPKSAKQTSEALYQ